MALLLRRIHAAILAAVLLSCCLWTAAAAQTPPASPSPSTTPVASVTVTPPTANQVVQLNTNSDPVAALYAWIMGGATKLMTIAAILGLVLIAIRIAVGSGTGRAQDLNHHWQLALNIGFGIGLFCGAGRLVIFLMAALGPFFQSTLQIPAAYCTNGIVC